MTTAIQTSRDFVANLSAETDRMGAIYALNDLKVMLKIWAKDISPHVLNWTTRTTEFIMDAALALSNQNAITLMSALEKGEVAIMALRGELRHTQDDAKFSLNSSVRKELLPAFLSTLEELRNQGINAKILAHLRGLDMRIVQGS